MKAMCIDENKNFVWTDVADSVCHDEFDVKIAIRACAVNRADLMQRQGIYAPPEGWPLWPAFEARKFAPFVHKVMPIAEATEAHAILERGENRGKVVLTV